MRVLMTTSASGTLKRRSETSRYERVREPGTHLSPSLEFCLEFRQSIDLDLNIYTWGVRLIEAKLEDPG